MISLPWIRRNSQVSTPERMSRVDQAVDILVDLLFVSDIAWEPRVARGGAVKNWGW
jgi:hypothetical protein